MSAIVNPAIVSHIEYLCDEAEYWQSREQHYLDKGDTEQAAWCREQWDRSEQRAMKWAQQLEAA